MTGNAVSNAFAINAPKPADARSARFVSGQTLPFANKAAAFADTPAGRRSIMVDVAIGAFTTPDDFEIYNYQRASTYPTGGESGDGWDLVLKAGMEYVAPPFHQVSADFTIFGADDFTRIEADRSAGDFEITLPSLVAAAGKDIFIKFTGTGGNITLIGTVNGQVNPVIKESIMLILVPGTIDFGSTDVSYLLENKVEKTTFGTLSSTTWDIGVLPRAEYALTGSIGLTLAGGEDGESIAILVVTNSGAFQLNIDGTMYEVRPSTINGGKTAISVMKMPDGSYYVSTDYTPATATPDIIPPTATFEATGPNTIIMTTNEPVTGTGSGIDFENGSPITVSGVVANSSTEYEFTTSTTMTPSDVITASIAGSDIQDIPGNAIEDTVTPIAVTNSISAGGSGIAPLDFTGSSAIIALGGGGDDWTYDPANGMGSYGNLGKANVAVAAAADGRIICDHINGSGSNKFVLGIHTSNTEVAYAGMIAGFLIDSSANVVYPIESGGAIGSTIAIGASASVCFYCEAGGGIKIQTSPQAAGGPYTWTTIHTMVATSTAKRWVVADSAGVVFGGQSINTYGENLVP